MSTKTRCYSCLQGELHFVDVAAVADSNALGQPEET